MRRSGFGIKAATITPEGADDVGSPNRILREEVQGKVIIRTGRRIPGITPVAGVHYPISIVRMAVEDAYGAEQWREGEAGAGEEVAFRKERITRSVCRAVAEYAFRQARKMNGRVYGGPKWTVSPVYEGMLKEEMDDAAARSPDVRYQPVLIDATYAGLISGAADEPLVIPALNRDGDCLSDLVMPMFGSIAGAESVLLGFDDAYNTTVAMAEAPHGTAPALLGKDVANPMAMILSCAAVLHYAATAGHADAERASRAIYESVLEATAAGVRTPDLGGRSTTEFTTDVLTGCAPRSTSGRRWARRSDEHTFASASRACKNPCTNQPPESAPSLHFGRGRAVPSAASRSVRSSAYLYEQMFAFNNIPGRRGQTPSDRIARRCTPRSGPRPAWPVPLLARSTGRSPSPPRPPSRPTRTAGRCAPPGAPAGRVRLPLAHRCAPHPSGRSIRRTSPTASPAATQPGLAIEEDHARTFGSPRSASTTRSGHWGGTGVSPERHPAAARDAALQQRRGDARLAPNPAPQRQNAAP